VAGHRLVHRVVQQLGHEVMKRAVVDAADVHAGATAHRFQALQHLDVVGGIGFGFRLGRFQEVAHGRAL